MVRKHLFLILALGVLGLMAVAGVVRLGFKPKGGGAGVAEAGAPGGGARRPGGGPGGGAAARGGPTQVAVHVIGPQTFSDKIEVLGAAKARQSVTLTADTTELITRIRFQSGDFVRQGQVLAELNAREQAAGTIQAQAAVDIAKRNLDRWQILADRGVAPKATAEQYQSAYDQAVANLEASRARTADRTIRAPFSGVVGLSDAAPGMLINPGTAIATLDDLTVIRVDFPVSERYMATLRQGLPITATADAYPREQFRGKIAQIDTRVDVGTRAVTARAEFPNPDRRLKPGMLLHVTIQEGDRQSASAPEAAVMFEAGSAYVFAIQPNPKGPGLVAERRNVVTGLRQANMVEILSGVELGDRIVGEGVNRIRANEPVRPVGAGAPGGPGAGPPGGGPPGQVRGNGPAGRGGDGPRPERRRGA